MKFDLHIHSHYSDGSFSPSEVMQKCHDCGLETISLTDHETLRGVSEAREAGKRLGIKVIPGMEFSTAFRGVEHHILGYFVEDNEELGKFLDSWRETKIVQIKKIVGNLQGMGFKITFEQVLAQVRGSLDRFQISLAMFPDFEKTAEGRDRQKAFFRKFLLEKSAGGEGLAFVERDKPDTQAVIDAIHYSGGLAFWAHPFWKIKDMPAIREFAQTFQKIGLDGIEVLYSFHTEERTLFLRKVTRDLSILESGGSDFHREDSTTHLAGFPTFGAEINFPFDRDGERSCA